MVTEGKESTEFAVTKTTSFWGQFASVIGSVLAVGGAALPYVGQFAPPTAAVIVGGVLAVAGAIQQTLAQLGYVKSRTAVKTATRRP